MNRRTHILVAVVSLTVVGCIESDSTFTSVSANSSTSPPPQCLEYQPTVVTLSGRFEIVGIPASSGRVPFINSLSLDQPICIQENTTDPSEFPLAENIDRVHLLIPVDDRVSHPGFDEYHGEAVVVSGRLRHVRASNLPLNILMTVHNIDVVEVLRR